MKNVTKRGGLKMPANLRLVPRAPSAEKQKVKRAGRKSDADYGRDGHKYLTADQVGALIKEARHSRNGLRDALMVSLCYHHGLRVSELLALRWNAVNFKAADMAVNRIKNGRSNRQPLDGDDLRALRALYRERKSDEWIFTSEQGGPFTRDGFAKLLKAAAKRTGIKNVHPHALRHACGHVLAVKGKETRLLGEWLGHRNLNNTGVYTEGVSARFRGMWD
jgi:type 1 fimbriae regulatory protein FimB